MTVPITHIRAYLDKIGHGCWRLQANPKGILTVHDVHHDRFACFVYSDPDRTLEALKLYAKWWL